MKIRRKKSFKKVRGTRAPEYPGTQRKNKYPGTRSAKWHYPAGRVGSGLQNIKVWRDPFRAGARRVLPPTTTTSIIDTLNHVAQGAGHRTAWLMNAWFQSSGGWVKYSLSSHTSTYQIHVVFRFNPRSRCNNSSRCCYRAREHVDPA